MSLKLVVDNTVPAPPPVVPPLVKLVRANPGDLWIKARKWARKIRPGHDSIIFSWRKQRCRVRPAEHDGHATVLLEFLDANDAPVLLVSWAATPDHPLLGRPLIVTPEEERDGAWRSV